MKSKIKYTLCILLSSLFTFFVCDAGNTVFKQLDAAYDGIQLKLEDDIVKLKDTNDNPIEIFTVDGTAYLPVRAISELMEIECNWNGDLKQIEIHDPKRRFPRQLDLNEVDWLSYQLRSFNEVGLYAFRHDKGREYFRFLYLPSFTEPCLIDIYLHNGKYELSFKKTNGAGGFYAGELIMEKTKELTASDLEQLKNRLEECGFWEAPFYNGTKDGTDGTSWIIEAVSCGKYNIVKAWSPEEGFVREIGELFIKLSGETITNLS